MILTGSRNLSLIDGARAIQHNAPHETATELIAIA